MKWSIEERDDSYNPSSQEYISPEHRAYLDEATCSKCKLFKILCRCRKMKAKVTWREVEQDFMVEWLGATPDESQFHYAKTIDGVLKWCRQQNIGYLSFPDQWVQIAYDK